MATTTFEKPVGSEIDTLNSKAVKFATYTQKADTDSTVIVPISIVGINGMILSAKCTSTPNIVCIPYRATGNWWLILRTPSLGTVAQATDTYEIAYI